MIAEQNKAAVFEQVLQTRLVSRSPLLFLFLRASKLYLDEVAFLLCQRNLNREHPTLELENPHVDSLTFNYRGEYIDSDWSVSLQSVGYV